MSELKQIKRYHEQQLKNMDKKLTMYQIHPDDVSWLINRVEELEKEKDEWKDTAQSYYMTNQELREQNKRYKQALEFYADEETYETKFATDTDEIFDPFTLIELDEGKRARKALEKSK